MNARPTRPISSRFALAADVKDTLEALRTSEAHPAGSMGMMQSSATSTIVRYGVSLRAPARTTTIAAINRRLRRPIWKILH